MMRSVWRLWPLFAALAAYGATVAIMLSVSVRQNQGHLIYTYDDAYIHMAMAKNFARHGVWGVTRHEFASASSSPLWTLLLAVAFKLLGEHDVIPLLLNVLACILTLVVAYRFLEAHLQRAFPVLAGLLLLIFAAPLPSLTLAGMEHSLHTLLALLFACLSAEFLSLERLSSRQLATLLVLAPVLALVRYEGLFLVGAVALLFILRGKVGMALGLGASGFLFVTIYGIVALRQGWYFLPNSLLLKGALPELTSLGGAAEFLGKAAVRRVCSNPYILVLSLLSLLAIVYQGRNREKAWKSPILWSNASFMIAVLLHMQFVGQGWAYRYEAYLVSLGVVVITAAGGELLSGELALGFQRDRLPQYLAAGILALLVGHALGERSLPILLKTSQATTNIYEQQYQMGLFLHRFYEGQSVAANDIGAISYLADIRLLDLEGLGSLKPATLRMKKAFNAAQVRALTAAERTSIAIVYEGWFQGILDDWSKVGEWKIRNRVVAAEDTVSFWAVDPSQKESLIRNLQAFAGQLPATVLQSGEYTQGIPPAAPLVGTATTQP